MLSGFAGNQLKHLMIWICQKAAFSKKRQKHLIHLKTKAAWAAANPCWGHRWGGGTSGNHHLHHHHYHHIIIIIISSLSSHHPLHHHHYQSSHPPPPHQAGPRLILDDFTDSLYASKSTIAFGVSSLSFFDHFVNTQHDVKHCQRHKGPMGWVSPLFLWKCLFFCKLFNG